MAKDRLLIDLSSICYPIWHMSQSDPDPNATSIKTVARIRALSTGRPHAAVCCDSGRSFRADIADTYKANRAEQDGTLQHQITLAREQLEADGFPVWAVKGFEADDIIASATALALATEGALVLIVTADKDLLQLVGDRVRAMSVKDGSIIDAEGVKVKIGVRPDQMRDYLTLTGDTSDNIAGCKGVGPKRAAALLSTFGTLDALYEQLIAKGGALIGLPPAMSHELRAFKASGAFAVARALVTLRTDVDLPFAEIDRERVPKDAATFGEDEMDHDADEDYVPTAAIVDAAPSDAVTPEGAAPQLPLTDAASPAHHGGGDPGQPAPTALAVREPDAIIPADFEMQLEPRSMRDAKTLATDMFQSRLFSQFGTPQAVLSVLMAGREVGMQAMASLRAFHVIDGKPTLAADLIRAIVIKSGKAKYFRCTERTAERATFETQRGDDPPMSLTYTVAEGRIAFPGDDKAWAKSGWGRNPADLCVARAGSKLARLVYADVIHGLYAREEMD